MVHLKIWGSVYTVCERETFRRKPLKEKEGGKDKGRKEEGVAWMFCPGVPGVPSCSTV